MKLWEAKQMFTYGLLPVLNAQKMMTLHSTIKCPKVLFEMPKGFHFSINESSKCYF